MKIETAHATHTISESKVGDKLWELRMKETTDMSFFNWLSGDKTLGSIRQDDNGNWIAVTIFENCAEPMRANSRKQAVERLLEVATNKRRIDARRADLAQPYTNSTESLNALKYLSDAITRDCAKFDTYLAKLVEKINTGDAGEIAYYLEWGHADEIQLLGKYKIRLLDLQKRIDELFDGRAQNDRLHITAKAPELTSKNTGREVIEKVIVLLQWHVDHVTDLLMRREPWKVNTSKRDQIDAMADSKLAEFIKEQLSGVKYLVK